MHTTSFVVTFITEFSSKALSGDSSVIFIRSWIELTSQHSHSQPHHFTPTYPPTPQSSNCPASCYFRGPWNALQAITVWVVSWSSSKIFSPTEFCISLWFVYLVQGPWACRPIKSSIHNTYKPTIHHFLPLVGAAIRFQGVLSTPGHPSGPAPDNNE